MTELEQVLIAALIPPYLKLVKDIAVWSRSGNSESNQSSTGVRFTALDRELRDVKSELLRVRKRLHYLVACVTVIGTSMQASGAAVRFPRETDFEIT